ncbi:hypothetical protein ACFSC0_06565 [Phenylobacterium terrae]|uniref:Uncharacterized protein n=2 Tax=Phenylobacterium terrae TaxID=2665495 RepID=A0ABW4N318_9CAUL
MRTALVSLVALAGFSTAAVAQPAETPPAQPAAPAAPATPATPPAAAPAAPAAPATEPAPQRPTSGVGAVVLDAIERICVPLVRGGDADQLAKAYGLRKRRDVWVGTLETKPYTIALSPQRSDKNTCELTVEFAIGQDETIAKALHTWSFLHQPELKPYRSDIRPDPVNGNQLTTRSWEHFTNTDSIGLVFVLHRKADGSPVERNRERAKILYQERKLTEG